MMPFKFSPTPTELPPNCKIIISSKINGAEFPLTNISYTIAIVDNSNNQVNANKNITVNYILKQSNYLGATIDQDVDYQSPTNLKVTILNGTSSITLSINVIDDNIEENPEQLTLELTSSSDSNYPISTILEEKSANTYIIDNDKKDPNITFSKNDFKINLKIPTENTKGSLPSCFTTIGFYNVTDLLPIATHTTEGTLTVIPAYDPKQILKIDESRGNSAGKFTMYFYTRHDLKQTTGQFDLVVSFTEPLTFSRLDNQRFADNNCQKTYTLPTPQITTNPSCNRQIVISNILFDRFTEVTRVSDQPMKYKFPYGNTKVTFDIKEVIEGCLECDAFSTVKFNYTINRINNATINDITIPDLNLNMDVNVCRAILNKSALANTQANIGCQKLNLTLDPSTPSEFNTYGEHSITYTLNDNSNGLNAMPTQKLIIKDNEPPQLTLSTNNFTVKTTLGSCTYNFKNSDFNNILTANDLCNSTPNIRFSTNEGSPIGIGTYTIMVWAVDLAGNTSAKQQIQLMVQINDANYAPDFKTNPIEIQKESNQETVSVVWEEPILPTCYNISLQKSHEPKDNFTLGTHQVVYTYSFPNGEKIQKTLTIIVNNNENLDNLNQIKVYKAISPNNDGKNDYWHIDKIDIYIDNIVNVYNETGKLVFQAQGYNNDNIVWRGTNNLTNSQLPKGLYFYQIKIPSKNHQINGSVLLFR